MPPGKKPGNRPVAYTISTCPACNRLKKDWTEQGIDFEERQVDKKQTWMDEARLYGDTVPLVVYTDGRVETGYANMIG
ncbi:MAG: glutaredoxin domain-containing protein [Dehalococcoidia bacterium]|nr:glutaredoxin domain-containing protein [Dehalococcoidia bacterium]